MSCMGVFVFVFVCFKHELCFCFAYLLPVLELACLTNLCAGILINAWMSGHLTNLEPWLFTYIEKYNTSRQQ